MKPSIVTNQRNSVAAVYRPDIVVEDRVMVEIKAVDRILPVHEAQMLTYLRLARLRAGLLMNFNNVVLKDGLRRFVL